MGHTLRGAVVAWLGLIALQTVVSNSGQASGALATINNLIQRALSPNVPAIPDRRSGSAAGSGGYFNMTPEQLKQVVDAANAGIAVQAAGPGAAWNQLPGANAYAGAGSGIDWGAVAGSPYLAPLNNIPHLHG
jgi:hypothetical protein